MAEPPIQTGDEEQRRRNRGGLTPRETILLRNYSLLVKFIISDGKLFWDRFNVLTVLDSGLFALSLAEQVVGNQWSVLCVSTIGIVVSCYWVFVTARARAYYKHWIKKAREIEDSKLTDLDFFTSEEQLQRSWSWYEKLSATRCAIVVPLTFLAIWIIRAIIAACAVRALLLDC